MPTSITCPPPMLKSSDFFWNVLWLVAELLDLAPAAIRAHMFCLVLACNVIFTRLWESLFLGKQILQYLDAFQRIVNTVNWTWMHHVSTEFWRWFQTSISFNSKKLILTLTVTVAEMSKIEANCCGPDLKENAHSSMFCNQLCGAIFVCPDKFANF